MKKKILLALGLLAIFFAGISLGFALRNTNYQGFPAYKAQNENLPATDLERCLDKELKRLKNLAPRTVLVALDGRVINLERYPSLPEKFYYWENETKIVKTRAGPHRARIYWNTAAKCNTRFSSKGNPRALYGDVAEIYDTRGKFRGFAVYSGEKDLYFFHYERARHNSPSA